MPLPAVPPRMPPFLVKARLKPETADDFRARVDDGTLADGEPYQDALLAALRGAHTSRQDLYFMLEGRNDSLRDERRALEPFMDIKSVQPVHQAFEAGADDLDDD